MAEPRVTIGWDIGGAHAKACRVEAGRVVDIVQWPCALWQGLSQLDAVWAQARTRWPDAASPGVRQAATMTGEMVDLFPDRAAGVRRLAAHLAEALGPSLRLFTGVGGGDAAHGAGARWASPGQAGHHWSAIASANWRATAEWLAGSHPDALLVDIGSTTTDLIPLRAGMVVAQGRSDAERLASGELVYQGVVRTPLCALGQQRRFRGVETGVMNEWFATSADVYRLLGRLEAQHDQQPTADQAGKDLPATRQRLARMIGHDAVDAEPADWLELAAQWAEAQQALIARALCRVAARAALAGDAPLVAAGCGDFLVPALAQAAGRRSAMFAETLPWAPTAAAGLRGWAQVCAPAVAVALLAEAAPPWAGD